MRKNSVSHLSNYQGGALPHLLLPEPSLNHLSYKTKGVEQCSKIW